MKDYTTYIFDCDGVLLDSNPVKSEAFYNLALEYSKDSADELVAYHTTNGGVSRYKKLAYYLESILPKYKIDSIGIELDHLLAVYARNVKSGMLSCDVAPGLNHLRNQTKNAKWLVVSGGDQAELREIFRERGLDSLFDGGIFGSPDDKKVILDREIKSGNIRFPAVFLGDSRYDFEVAIESGLDFVYVKDWSEWKDGEEFCRREGYRVLGKVGEVFKNF